MRPQDLRLRRSLLCVPGTDARKFERAAKAGADTILFDLEDAVAPEHKLRAREPVALRRRVLARAERAAGGPGGQA